MEGLIQCRSSIIHILAYIPNTAGDTRLLFENTAGCHVKPSLTFPLGDFCLHNMAPILRPGASDEAFSSTIYDG